VSRIYVRGQLPVVTRYSSTNKAKSQQHHQRHQTHQRHQSQTAEEPKSMEAEEEATSNKQVAGKSKVVVEAPNQTEKSTSKVFLQLSIQKYPSIHPSTTDTVTHSQSPTHSSLTHSQLTAFGISGISDFTFINTTFQCTLFQNSTILKCTVRHYTNIVRTVCTIAIAISHKVVLAFVRCFVHRRRCRPWRCRRRSVVVVVVVWWMESMDALCRLDDSFVSSVESPQCR